MPEVKQIKNSLQCGVLGKLLSCFPTLLVVKQKHFYSGNITTFQFINKINRYFFFFVTDLILGISFN